MKQVVQNIRTGETSLVDVPVPLARPGTVVVHNRASLISLGTERTLVEFAEKGLLDKARSRPDLVRRVVDKARREGIMQAVEAVRSGLEEPFTLGYSSAGVVTEVGEGVSDISVGDRVACAGASASHAEWVCVPEMLVAPVPDRVADEDAAFTTLGAIAVHGFRLSEAGLRDVVVVLGLGVVGLLTAQIARAAGTAVLGVDPDTSRVELARSLGLRARPLDRDDQGAVADTVASLSRGRGADAVLITAATSDSGPVEMAGELARDRGRVVVVGAVGMEIPRRTYYEKELDFRVSRSYGPGRYDATYEEKGIDYPVGYVRWTENRNMLAFLDLLEAGDVEVAPLVTHRYPIGDAADAYRLISDGGEEPVVGVLLSYPDAGEPDADSPAGRKIELQPEIDVPARAQLGIGMVGAGSFARRTLLPLLSGTHGTRLVGLATATGVSGQEAGRRHGFDFITSDADEVLTHPDIDTVVIASRHHLHPNQAGWALESGKHVFVEKPPAIDEAGLTRVVGAALRSPKQIFMVGYNRRFSPMIREVASFFRTDNSESGSPLMLHYRVNAGHLPPDSWIQDPEIGGGRIVGELCHFVDTLIALTGSLPRTVSCLGLPNRGAYSDDNVTVELEFADGSIGTITYVASGDLAAGKELLEVFGGGRTALLDDFRRLDLFVDGRRRTLRNRFRQDKGHAAELQAFLEAVKGEQPRPIALAEIVAVSLATFGATESLRSGSRVSLDVNGLIQTVAPDNGDGTESGPGAAGVDAHS